jgi:hypothetical protein
MPNRLALSVDRDVPVSMREGLCYMLTSIGRPGLARIPLSCNGHRMTRKSDLNRIHPAGCVEWICSCLAGCARPFRVRGDFLCLRQ